MKEIFYQAMMDIAGTCMLSTRQVLEHYMQDVSDAVVSEFEEYLEANDCHECVHCGWWNHPGEDCECLEYEEEYECEDCWESERSVVCQCE